MRTLLLAHLRIKQPLQEGRMDYRQAVWLSALKRAKLFFQKYARELGAFAASPSFERLDNLIRDWDANGSTQHGAVKQAKAATVSKRELRKRLRQSHMEKISAIARAKLAGIPTAKMAKFSVPNTTVTDVTLLEAGRSMLAVAKEFEQVFKQEKLPDDFLAQLEGAVNALQDSILSRDGDQMERHRATLGLVGQVHLAKQIGGILNGFVLHVFEHKPEIIGEWKMAMKIGSTIRSRRRPAGIDPATQAGVETPPTGGIAPTALPA